MPPRTLLPSLALAALVLTGLAAYLHGYPATTTGSGASSVELEVEVPYSLLGLGPGEKAWIGVRLNYGIHHSHAQGLVEWGETATLRLTLPSLDPGVRSGGSSVLLPTLTINALIAGDKGICHKVVVYDTYTFFLDSLKDPSLAREAALEDPAALLKAGRVTVTTAYATPCTPLLDRGPPLPASGDVGGEEACIPVAVVPLGVPEWMREAVFNEWSARIDFDGDDSDVEELVDRFFDSYYVEYYFDAGCEQSDIIDYLVYEEYLLPPGVYEMEYLLASLRAGDESIPGIDDYIDTIEPGTAETMDVYPLLAARVYFAPLFDDVDGRIKGASLIITLERLYQVVHMYGISLYGRLVDASSEAVADFDGATVSLYLGDEDMPGAMFMVIYAPATITYLNDAVGVFYNFSLVPMEQVGLVCPSGYCYRVRPLTAFIPEYSVSIDYDNLQGYITSLYDPTGPGAEALGFIEESIYSFGSYVDSVKVAEVFVDGWSSWTETLDTSITSSSHAGSVDSLASWLAHLLLTEGIPLVATALGANPLFTMAWSLPPGGLQYTHLRVNCTTIVAHVDLSVYPMEEAGSVKLYKYTLDEHVYLYDYIDPHLRPVLNLYEIYVNDYPSNSNPSRPMTGDNQS